MAKFRDLRQVVKGKRAVTDVTFRLANAPNPPHAPEEDAAGGSALVPIEVTCGVRVLTTGEQEEIFARALADAKSREVEKWDGENPICRLAQMVRTLEVACVDCENHDQPFFANAEEIRDSHDLGADNMAILFEAQDAWQDACTFKDKTLSVERMVALIAEEAERDENALGPFSRLRPGQQQSCFRFMARLFINSQMASLQPSSGDDTSSTDEPSKQENPKTEPS